MKYEIHGKFGLINLILLYDSEYRAVIYDSTEFSFEEIKKAYPDSKYDQMVQSAISQLAFDLKNGTEKQKNDIFNFLKPKKPKCTGYKELLESMRNNLSEITNHGEIKKNNGYQKNKAKKPKEI